VDRHGQANTISFVADVLEHHARAQPIGGNLSKMVEVTLFEGAARAHLLHLVNGSGAWTGVAPITMRDLAIEIAYPGEPSAVTGLVDGRPLDWARASERLTIRLPQLDLFEAIRIASG
jgi:hypothetical protein